MHGDGSQRYGLRNSQALIPHMPFAVLQYSYGGVDSVIASPVNSQAHRKHFDLRRTYGLNSN